MFSGLHRTLGRNWSTFWENFLNRSSTLQSSCPEDQLGFLFGKNSSFNHIRTLNQNTQALHRNFFSGLINSSFWLSGGTFWATGFSRKKNIFSSSADIERNISVPLVIFFGGCAKTTFHMFKRVSWRKKLSRKRNVYF